MTSYEPDSVGWWMDERRGELGMTWDNVAEKAGVSVETLYRAASGRPMRTPTKKGVERALDWAPGSIDTISSGGSPTPLDTTSEPPRDRDAELDELRQRSERLLSMVLEMREVVDKMIDDRDGKRG